MRAYSRLRSSSRALNHLTYARTGSQAGESGGTTAGAEPAAGTSVGSELVCDSAITGCGAGPALVEPASVPVAGVERGAAAGAGVGCHRSGAEPAPRPAG